MEYSDDILAPKAKYICFHCVGEVYLSAEIERDGAVAACAYCGATEQAITVEELADRVESAFADHYTRTSDQPDWWQQSLLSDRESDYVWLRDGDPVIDAIESAAEIPRDAASEVQTILDDRHGDRGGGRMCWETEFSPETHYERKGPDAQDWHEEWRSFERSLKTEARFFSRIATNLLARVFGNIGNLTAC